MNELVHIVKEITRLWREKSNDPYGELQEMGYKMEDIKTVVLILKEGSMNMDEHNKSDDKWKDFTWE